MNVHVKSIPEGYHSVTPYILVDDVSKALRFYKLAFGAKELLRLEVIPGQISHAEFKIGNSVIMISETSPHNNQTPYSGTCRNVCFMVYVDDVDAASQMALSAGMKLIKEVQNQFYGDRAGTFEDPFGHVWTISTHVEDVSVAEVTKRMKKFSETKTFELKGEL